MFFILGDFCEITWHVITVARTKAQTVFLNLYVIMSVRFLSLATNIISVKDLQ